MKRIVPSLAGLNEGLRVQHTATFPVLWCSAADDLGAVLARPDLEGIDQIPINDGERIIAVWEHSPSRKWTRRPLDDSLPFPRMLRSGISFIPRISSLIASSLNRHGLRYRGFG